MQEQLIRQLRRLSAQRWRQYTIEQLIRSLSIGLLVACIGAMLPVFGFAPLPRSLFGWIIVGSTMVGCLRALKFRLTPTTAARRLDRRFGLQEQLSTALELQGAQVGVAGRLQAQAQESVQRVQRYLSRSRQPIWSEALMPVALLLMLAGLLMIVSPPIPAVGEAEPLPDLLQPDPVATQPDPIPTEAALSPVPGNDLDVISALADALRDQALTRPAAEALDQGDLAGAADALRELADQMGEISPAAREALAESLREAARAIDQTRPDLADQLRATADALQYGDGVAGATGMDALADALERQPTAPVAGGGGGAGNTPGSQRREQSFNPSGVDGTPLELTTDGSGQVPTTGTSAEQSTGASAGELVIRPGSVNAGGPVQTATDPLQIPTDVRDVVRNYFSP